MSKTRWMCIYCSGPIEKDQLFTFISKGSVHFTCLEKEAGQRSEEKSGPLLRLLKAELDLIVAYKKYIGSVSDDEARKLSEANEKDSERHAAQLSKLLDKVLGAEEG